MKRPRCPNGSRKNKMSVCTKKENAQTQKERRCKNGSRKNKLRVCVEINNHKRKSTSRKQSDRNTPRSLYAKKYFLHNQPLHLFADPTKNVILFQVNYNIEQLLHYQNLINGNIKQPIDCVFQSLFSIGLRNVKLAKNDSENVNLYKNSGVNTIETSKYIHSAFNLTPNEIVEYQAVSVYTNKKGIQNTSQMIDKKIERFFKLHLENDYATIIFIKYRPKSNNIQLSHAFIVYKYRDEVHFFDPQSKGIRPQSKVYTNHVSDIIDTRVNDITHYFYCRIWNLKTPKQLYDDSCPIISEG